MRDFKHIRPDKGVTISQVSNGYIVSFPVPPVDYGKAAMHVAANIMKQDRLGLDSIEGEAPDSQFIGLVPFSYMDYETKVFTNLSEMLSFLSVQFSAGEDTVRND